MRETTTTNNHHSLNSQFEQLSPVFLDGLAFVGDDQSEARLNQFDRFSALLSLITKQIFNF
jgi:hypothetical protein